jgi:hypothetical protein
VNNRENQSLFSSTPSIWERSAFDVVAICEQLSAEDGSTVETVHMIEGRDVLAVFNVKIHEFVVLNDTLKIVFSNHHSSKIGISSG